MTIKDLAKKLIGKALTWWSGADYVARIAVICLTTIAAVTVAGAVTVANLLPSDGEKPPTHSSPTPTPPFDGSTPAPPNEPPSSPTPTEGQPTPTGGGLPTLFPQDPASPVPPSGQPSGLDPAQARTITPGAFCPSAGATGRTATGATYVCRQKGAHARWEPVD